MTKTSITPPPFQINSHFQRREVVHLFRITIAHSLAYTGETLPSKYQDPQLKETHEIANTQTDALLLLPIASEIVDFGV